MTPLIASGRNRLLFFIAVAVLLLISVALVPLGLVRVKMLPFDNKSELQVIVNMPDGTPLEQTRARYRRLWATNLRSQPDVLNYQIYTGTSGPYNFNGLVRHYYMRRMPNQADIQVNLAPAKAAQRSEPRHRQAAAPACSIAIGNQYGARIQVSEVPARTAGDSNAGGRSLRSRSRRPDTASPRRSRRSSSSTPGVVDTDWYVEDPQPRLVMQRGRGEGRAAWHRGRGCGPRTGARHLGNAGRPAPRSRRARAHPRGRRTRPRRSFLRAGAGEYPSARRGRLHGLAARVARPSNTRPSSPASITRTCAAWSMSPATWPARKRARSTPS